MRSSESELEVRGWVWGYFGTPEILETANIGPDPSGEGWRGAELYMLAPRSIAICDVDGLWRLLNASCGLALEQAESDVLSPDQARSAAAVIAEFVGTHYMREELLERSVGVMVPSGSTITARCAASELRRVLLGLSDFLRVLSAAGKSVEVGF